MVYSFPENLSKTELQERIRNADSAFENALSKAASRIASVNDLRVIGLVGPTCSGKTTAAKMLTEYLFQKGHTVHIISIDDFFFEKNYLLELSRQTENHTLDYDSERTIDTDLLGKCVHALLAGSTVQLPHFNFLSGQRESGVCLTPKKTDLFLFEGIQILYPNVSSILNGNFYTSIAVCPQSDISVGGKAFSPNQIRFMRRLVRDSIYRGATFSFTFSLWENVRKNEEKNIFPYLQNCDLYVDSTMPYEIGVLKPFLQSGLKRILPDDAFYETACKMQRSLSNVQTVDCTLISQSSLYREFI